MQVKDLPWPIGVGVALVDQQALGFPPADFGPILLAAAWPFFLAGA